MNAIKLVLKMSKLKINDYVDNPFNNPAILSLCPGIRGIERGLERAIGRIRTVAYVEIEAFIIENLVAEMEEGLLAPAPIWSDIKTFDGKPFRNKIHGIIGGYPCQPFSNAGQRNGTEDPRHLYPFISGIIKAARPIWCFFENVEGHLSLGYSEVSADLRTMGYSVEAGIYSAEEVGAPHERNRLFILAIQHEYMANPGGYGNKEGYGGRGVEYPSRKSEEEIRERKRVWIKSAPGGEQNVAYSTESGLQIGRESQSNKQSPIERGGREDVWPARPGEEQYEWEEPRVESKMGSTINGYDFREDFLRALGNSVVEQTAEIAFLDLLRKHKESPQAAKVPKGASQPQPID